MSIRKAAHKEKATVSGILEQAFEKDPHVNWLLEKSNNPQKLRILTDYLFDETIRKGEIYINEDNSAVILFNSNKKEKISVHYAHRNASFLFKIGIRAVARILKMENRVNKIYPKDSPYSHLLMIAVSSEARGKGLASTMMNPFLTKMNEQNIPVYLETANKTNVEIYKHKGFEVETSVKDGLHELFVMVKN